MKRMIVLILLILPIVCFAVLKEMNIQKVDKPKIIPIFRNYPDFAAVILYSSIPNLTFESNMDGIIEDKSKPEEGKYTIIIKPMKQMITVKAFGYMEDYFKVGNINAKECLYYSVEPKSVPLNPEKGNFVLRTIPKNADIQIDGFPDFAKKTPYTFENYSAQEYSLIISKNRYDIVETSISIEKGKTKTKTIELVPQWGDLEITSNPSGAIITINDSISGKTPFELKGIEKGLEKGIYNVKYRIDSLSYYTHTFQNNLEIKAGELTEELLNFDEYTSSLTINVSPKPISVMINGKLNTTLSNGKAVRFPEGIYNVSVKRDKNSPHGNYYTQINREVAIKKGKAESISGILEINHVKVSLDSNKDDTFFELVDLETGKTVYSGKGRKELEILPGKYNVVGKFEGYKDKQENYTISTNTNILLTFSELDQRGYLKEQTVSCLYEYWSKNFPVSFEYDDFAKNKQTWVRKWVNEFKNYRLYKSSLIKPNKGEVLQAKHILSYSNDKNKIKISLLNESFIEYSADYAMSIQGEMFWKVTINTNILCVLDSSGNSYNEELPYKIINFDAPQSITIILHKKNNVLFKAINSTNNREYPMRKFDNSSNINIIEANNNNNGVKYAIANLKVMIPRLKVAKQNIARILEIHQNHLPKLMSKTATITQGESINNFLLEYTDKDNDYIRIKLLDNRLTNAIASGYIDIDSKNMAIGTNSLGISLSDGKAIVKETIIVTVKANAKQNKFQLWSFGVSLMKQEFGIEYTGAATMKFSCTNAGVTGIFDKGNLTMIGYSTNGQDIIPVQGQITATGLPTNFWVILENIDGKRVWAKIDQRDGNYYGDQTVNSFTKKKSEKPSNITLLECSTIYTGERFAFSSGPYLGIGAILELGAYGQLRYFSRNFKYFAGAKYYTKSFLTKGVENYDTSTWTQFKEGFSGELSKQINKYRLGIQVSYFTRELLPNLSKKMEGINLPSTNFKNKLWAIGLTISF